MSTGFHPTVDVQKLYEEHTGDPTFERVVSALGADGDGRLAELIEADGRLRLRLDRPVELGRYIDAVPDLRARAEPLDAAIDMALRWLSKSGTPDSESVEQLARRYPDFAKAIRDAAALSNAIWSTTRLRTDVAAVTTVRPLPCDFGPPLPDGRPRYELRKLLGEGAFGKVYLAADRQLSDPDRDALVSIKVLIGEQRDPWARQRFIEEATKARRIDHPNVVRVLDRGVSDQDEEFIVYEYIEGGDLARWVRRQQHPIPLRRAVSLMASIAEGLHAAHAAGLVHCDLKPGNIMVTAAGEPKIADFGIAIRTSRADPGVDAGYHPRGNLAFISPEQFRSEPGALTPPSDIYALGGVLFWLLTDRLPNGSTPEEIERVHSTITPRTQAPRISDERSQAGPDLDAICARAMAVRIQDRYASAQSMADDLRGWLNHETIAWTRPSVLRRTRLWIRRQPYIAAAIAIIVVLAGVGAYAGFKSSQRRARLDGVLAVTGTLRRNLKLARDEGMTIDLLPFLWGMEPYEDLFAELGQQESEYWVWPLRRSIIAKHLEKMRAEGRAGDMENVIWATALALWHANAAEYDESDVLTALIREEWSDRIPADDAWWSSVRAIEAISRAGRVCSQPMPSAGAAREAHFNRMRDAARLVEQALVEQNQVARGSQLHRNLYDRVAVIYDADHLDDPSRLEEHERLRSEVEGELDRVYQKKGRKR